MRQSKTKAAWSLVEHWSAAVELYHVALNHVCYALSKIENLYTKMWKSITSSQTKKNLLKITVERIFIRDFSKNSENSFHSSETIMSASVSTPSANSELKNIVYQSLQIHYRWKITGVNFCIQLQFLPAFVCFKLETLII